MNAPPDLTAEQWSELREKCEADINSVTRNLSQKDSFDKNKRRIEAGQVKREIRQTLSELDANIARLRRSLHAMNNMADDAPPQYQIRSGEMKRRQTALRKLEDALRRSQQSYEGRDGRGGRNKRLKQPIEESDQTINLDNHELIQKQEEMIQDQDKHLDEILVGVKSLRTMGDDISTELNVHDKLLTELDESVNQTDMKIKQNTNRVEHITEKTKGWSGCILMALLLAVIVILLVV